MLSAQPNASALNSTPSKMTAVLLLLIAGGCTANYTEWLHNFGHDTYQYPAFITEQMQRCVCTTDSTSSKTTCLEDGVAPSSDHLTFCLAKQFLAGHMPELDKNVLNGIFIRDIYAHNVMSPELRPAAHPSTSVPISNAMASLDSHAMPGNTTMGNLP